MFLTSPRVYKARHVWVGKVIHWELYKKLKYDHNTKWNMHKPASVLENEMHKILWDFVIQTDHQISARRRNNHGGSQNENQRTMKRITSLNDQQGIGKSATTINKKINSRKKWSKEDNKKYHAFFYAINKQSRRNTTQGTYNIRRERIICTDTHL